MKISISDFVLIVAKVVNSVFEDGKVSKDDLPKVFELISKEFVDRLNK